MTTHAEARAILTPVLDEFLGREATLAELQAAQAVAMLETYYGDGWKGEGKGSNNWGATQVGGSACEQGLGFRHGDSHADGSEYQGCFGIYTSARAGILAYLNVMFRKRELLIEAIQSGSLLNVATVMRSGGYYELAADKYADLLRSSVSKLSGSLEEPNQFLGRKKKSEAPSIFLALTIALAGLAIAGKAMR